MKLEFSVSRSGEKLLFDLQKNMELSSVYFRPGQIKVYHPFLHSIGMGFVCVEEELECFFRLD